MPEDITSELKDILERQKRFFFIHRTKDVSFRMEQLKTLKTAILAYEERLYEALWEDLHKSQVGTEEGYLLRCAVEVCTLRKEMAPVEDADQVVSRSGTFTFSALQMDTSFPNDQGRS